MTSMVGGKTSEPEFARRLKLIEILTSRHLHDVVSAMGLTTEDASCGMEDLHDACHFKMSSECLRV